MSCKKNISMVHFVFMDHEPLMSNYYIWQFDLARLHHMLAFFFLSELYSDFVILYMQVHLKTQ